MLREVCKRIAEEYYEYRRDVVDNAPEKVAFLEETFEAYQIPWSMENLRLLKVRLERIGPVMTPVYVDPEDGLMVTAQRLELESPWLLAVVQRCEVCEEYYSRLVIDFDGLSWYLENVAPLEGGLGVCERCRITSARQEGNFSSGVGG